MIPSRYTQINYNEVVMIKKSGTINQDEMIELREAASE
jgi:hypothetical protein